MMFNHLLSQRVTAGSWNKILPGENILLSGSRSHFIADQVDETIEQRLAEWDIHPSGPLPGQDDKVVVTAVYEMEQQYLSNYQDWCEGLIKAGLKAERRSLRSRVERLTWFFQDDDRLVLEFTLDKGCYANGVMRELLVATVAFTRS